MKEKILNLPANENSVMHRSVLEDKQVKSDGNTKSDPNATNEEEQMKTVVKNKIKFPMGLK